MLSSTTMRILAGIMLAAVVVLGTAYGQAPMNKLLIWLESHNNPRGMIVFMVSEAVCVTLLLPAVPLIIAAGLVFGFLKGLLCVWAAGAIGQIGAFLVTRSTPLPTASASASTWHRFLPPSLSSAKLPLPAS